MTWIKIIQDRVRYSNFVKMLGKQRARHFFIRWQNTDRWECLYDAISLTEEPFLSIDFTVHCSTAVEFVFFFHEHANSVGGSILPFEDRRSRMWVCSFSAPQICQHQKTHGWVAEQGTKALEPQLYCVMQLPYTINIRRNDRQMSSPSEIHFH
jgi:hypothetical protein